MSSLDEIRSELRGLRPGERSLTLPRVTIEGAIDEIEDGPDRDELKEDLEKLERRFARLVDAAERVIRANELHSGLCLEDAIDRLEECL